MKRIFFKGAIAASALLFFAACNNNNPNSTDVNGKGDSAASPSISPSSTTDTATMKSATMNTGGTTAKANEFVTKAAGGGMMEVELGKLAQTNASSQAVKDFAKQMVADHSKANAELQSIAAAENIDIPTAMPAEHMQHMQEFEAKKGADFDKAYVAMMVEGHDKTIADFKTAAASNPNDKVKAFAAKTLPTIEGHAAKIKAIQAKMK